jgi:hypothetical protein
MQCFLGIACGNQELWLFLISKWKCEIIFPLCISYLFKPLNNTIMNYRKERYQFKSIEESCGQGPFFCGLHAKVLKRMPKCKVKILRKQTFIMSTLFFFSKSGCFIVIFRQWVAIKLLYVFASHYLLVWKGKTTFCWRWHWLLWIEWAERFRCAVSGATPLYL